MAEGWIKIDRNIQNHWIYQDATKLKWWLTILLTVNYKDEKVMLGNQLIECKRGQSVRSLRNWAKTFMVTPKTILTFFRMLEKDTMITTENIGISTRLTVLNYDSYQDLVNTKETVKETRTTTLGKHEVNSKETRTTHKQESKESKEREESKENTSPMLKDQLQIFSNENPSKYTELMYSDFARYWGEPFQNGKFKGKQRWQGQDTWELGGRLATWFRRGTYIATTSPQQKNVKVILSADEKQ